MAHRILIPTPLRPFAGKQESSRSKVSTVGDALQGLVGQFGDLRRHLYNEDGRLRSFVNIYVNDEDIRHLDREQTALKAGDTISIVPSVAGGSGAAVRCAGTDARGDSALQPPPDHAGGRRRGAAQAQGGARAVRRRRRTGRAGRDVSGRGGRRHARASSTSTSSTRATCSGRSSTARPTSGKRKLEAARDRLAAMNPST